MDEFREPHRAGFGHSQAVISPLGGSVRKPETQAKTSKSRTSSKLDPGGSIRAENQST